MVEAIPPGRAVSFEREVFPQLVGNGLYGFLAEGYWIDIGTPERYLEATWDLLAGRVESTLPARDETGSLVYEGCLTSGAHIGPQTVLGRHCSVGTDSRVERSVLHDRVLVGADAVVVESILGRGRARGRAARASSPARSPGAGAVIGDGAVIGSGARLEPGARDPPGARVEAEASAADDATACSSDVLAQPHQLGDALWRVESAGIPQAAIAPAGWSCAGWAARRSAATSPPRRSATARRAPITTVRGYALESWTGRTRLVLCASYSGDTEETLACFEAAGAAGAPRVALTTGGKLAEAARAEGVPVIGVPSGMQPRAAVVYMTVGGARVRRAVRRRAGLRTEIEAAAGLLEQLGGVGTDARPRRSRQALAQAARSRSSTAPSPTAARRAAGRRQLNENAESAGFCGGAAGGRPQRDLRLGAGTRGRAAVRASSSRTPDQHPRVQRRVELTADEVERRRRPVPPRRRPRGDSRLERVMSLVLLGDLVCVYLARLDGVDPDAGRRDRRASSRSQEAQPLSQTLTQSW